MPLVVYGKRGNAEVLTAIDETAERLGLTTGLALAQARAMHPALDAVAEDAEADAQPARAASPTGACATRRSSPAIAPDGLLLDITGCAHLYGGEKALAADLAARLERAGLACSIAVAGTIGAALAAARYGAAGHHANGEERKLLSPLPLAALRLAAATVAALARVGLKRIGDIIDLPRAPLTARFGSRAPAPARPRAWPRARTARPRACRSRPMSPSSAFAEPIAREEDVLRTVERLAAAA